jgi:TRAP-type transport system small permease protein
MDSFWSLLETSQRLMKGLASVCLIGMALVTCTDVILRSTINKPIFGSEEIVSIFAILTIGFALPYAHRQNSHVGVEILYRLLSAKRRRTIKLLTDGVSFILFAVLAWQMFIYAQVTQNSGALSMNLELPMYRFVYALSFCLLVVALCMLQDIVLSLRKAPGKK